MIAIRSLLSFVLLSVMIFLASPAVAQNGTNVLLVINTMSPASEQIGAHYARRRLVPEQNIVRLQTEATDEIARAEYQQEIEAPIGDWIKRHNLQDRILYIVLTKGLPLRIQGTGGRHGSVASVDSELTLLYRRLVGKPDPIAGGVSNPYFRGAGSLADAKPFSHADHDIYLVARLDGFTQPEAIALIDRGMAAPRAGDFLLDSSASPAGRIADGWLRSTVAKLTEAGYGDRIVHEMTSDILAGRKNVLGYSSHGSNDPSIRQRRLGFGFVPGALATLFVSTDARTLQEPPEQWQPRNSGDPKLFFSGSPQSLTGDLIREGITGVAGSVAEPFVDGAIRPDVLFPAYVSGFNAIESFYLAMPYLGWQTIVFGDPLCAPFRVQKLEADHLNPRIDPATALPEYFYRRRLAFLTSTGVGEASAVLLLQAEAFRDRGDEAGMRATLEKATVTDPDLNVAHMLLATAYEKNKEYDLAIDRYRQVLAAKPDDVIALNNLAYALAVYKNAPKEALPIADKAFSASKGDPRIVDTMGWIHYLLGNTSLAQTLLVQAGADAPDNADIQLHLAQVLADLGHTELAITALKRSLELNKSLSGLSEVQKLNEKLRNQSPNRF